MLQDSIIHNICFTLIVQYVLKFSPTSDATDETTAFDLNISLLLNYMQFINMF